MLRLIFLLVMEPGPGLALRPLVLQLPGLQFDTFAQHKVDSFSYNAFRVELQTKVREDFTITEKAPTRAFSWLKAHLRHYLDTMLDRHRP